MRIAFAETFHFDPGETFASCGTRIGFPGEKQRQLDIFEPSERVQQLEGLKDGADFFPAKLRQSCVFQRGSRNSLRSTLPDVGKSIAPARFSSVDFPHPLRPTIATNSPRETSSESPSSARTRWPSVR